MNARRPTHSASLSWQRWPSILRFLLPRSYTPSQNMASRRITTKNISTAGGDLSSITLMSIIKGTFDLTTWACETKDPPGFDDGRLSTLCVVGSGARWITLILFPLSFALYIFVWLDQRGEQQLLTTGKNRRASWSEDY